MFAKKQSNARTSILLSATAAALMSSSVSVASAQTTSATTESELSDGTLVVMGMVSIVPGKEAAFDRARAAGAVDIPYEVITVPSGESRAATGDRQTQVEQAKARVSQATTEAVLRGEILDESSTDEAAARSTISDPNDAGSVRLMDSDTIEGNCGTSTVGLFDISQYQTGRTYFDIDMPGGILYWETTIRVGNTSFGDFWRDDFPDDGQAGGQTNIQEYYTVRVNEPGDVYDAELIEGNAVQRSNGNVCVTAGPKVGGVRIG